MTSRNKGIILSYADTVLNMVCGLFLSSFLLRALGDTEYGIYQTVASFANYLVLLEFGIGTVMTRNLSICRGQNASEETLKSHTATLWSINVLLAALIIGVSVIFYHSMDQIYAASLVPSQVEYGKKIFVIVSVHLIVSFFTQTFHGIALGFEDYSFAAVTRLVRTASRTVLLVALISACPQSILIAGVDAAVGVPILIFSWIYCQRKFPINLRLCAFDARVFRQSFPLCFAIFLQAIVNQANNNVAKFLVGILMSPEMVALYSVALYVFNIFSTVTTVPISMFAPEVSRQVGSGMSCTALTDMLVPAARLTSVVGGAILFGFIAAGQQFIEIVYGQSYLQAWLIAVIMMVPSYLNMLTGVLVNVLDVLNKRMVRSCLLLITTALNIFLTILFMKRWGLVGAAAAGCICTLLGQVIMMGIYYGCVLKVRLLYLYHQAFRGILPYQLLGTGAALALGAVIQNVYLSFILCGSVFVMIFALGSLISNRDIRTKLFRPHTKG